MKEPNGDRTVRCPMLESPLLGRGARHPASIRCSVRTPVQRGGADRPPWRRGAFRRRYRGRRPSETAPERVWTKYLMRLEWEREPANGAEMGPRGRMPDKREGWTRVRGAVWTMSEDEGKTGTTKLPAPRSCHCREYVILWVRPRGGRTCGPEHPARQSRSCRPVPEARHIRPALFAWERVEASTTCAAGPPSVWRMDEGTRRERKWSRK